MKKTAITYILIAIYGIIVNKSNNNFIFLRSDFYMANPAMKIISRPTAEYVDSPATMKGTFTKAFGLTLVTIVSAVLSGVYLAGSPAAYGILVLGMIVGVVLTIVTCFKPQIAAMTTPGYAVFEGAVLGIISAQFERMYFGISAIAVGITLATMFLMLFLWRAQIIKVTNQVRSVIISMTGAVAIFYFINIIASLFGFHLMPTSGIFGIAISFIIAGVAAFNFLLDFDNIEQAVSYGAPKYMEYFCAFGLLLTLVWLYIEILRLIQMILAMFGGDE